MTKIKDLVTVSVDTAFKLFPIDAERYELCALVAGHLVHALFGSDPLPVIQLEEGSVREYLHGTHHNFHTAAFAYAKVALEAKYVLPEHFKVLEIDYDRAKRVTASLSQVSSDYLEVSVHDDVNEVAATAYALLWGQLLMRLCGLPASQQLSS